MSDRMNPSNDEPSVDDINALLAEASNIDAAMGADVAIDDYRGFGTYTLTTEPIPFFLPHGVSMVEAIQEEIEQSLVLRSQSAYPEYRLKGDPLNAQERPIGTSEAYTCQVYFGSMGQRLNPLLSEDRREIRSNLAQLVVGRRDSQNKTMLGAIHNLLTDAANSLDVLEWQTNRDGDRIHCIGGDRTKAKYMVEQSWSLIRAISSTQEWVEELWGSIQTAFSLNSVRRSIDWLRDADLLAYHSEFEAGIYGASRRYTYIDVPGLLLLAEVLEASIGFDSLPSHNMSSIKALHDAVFPGFGYGRTGPSDMGEPDDWETSLEVREWSSWNSDTNGGKFEPSRRYFSTDVDEAMRSRFSEAIEQWRSARSKFGDAPITKAFKKAWEAMSAEFPELLGGSHA